MGIEAIGNVLNKNRLRWFVMWRGKKKRIGLGIA